MDGNAGASAVAKTASAILAHVDKKVRTVARLARGTMGRYVPNTAAVAIARHVNDQAAAVARLASTIAGLINGSQWDWTSGDDDIKAHMQVKRHASEAASAGPMDDEQAAFGANQKADEEAHHKAHRTANYMAQQGDGTQSPQGLEASSATIGKPRPRFLSRQKKGLAK
jgi:hypothetical protein